MFDILQILYNAWPNHIQALTESEQKILIPNGRQCDYYIYCESVVPGAFIHTTVIRGKVYEPGRLS